MKFKWRPEKEEASRPAETASPVGRTLFADRLKYLLELANELARLDCQDEICQRVVEKGRESLGFDRLAVWYFDEDPTMAFCSCYTDAKGRVCQGQGALVRMDRTNFFSEVREKTASSAIRGEGKLYDDKFKAVGRGSWVCAPMWGGEEAMGFILMDNLLRKEDVTEQDEELMSVLAGALAHICLVKRKDEDLVKRESEYRSTLDCMGDAIHVVDRDRRFVLWNNRFKQWAKTINLPEEVVGKELYEVMDFLPEKVRLEYDEVFEKGEILNTTEHMERSGQKFDLEVCKIPIRDGKVVDRVVTVIRDVSQRKHAEEALQESQDQLQQAQKMEALGRLAGGIAHDFNNLLTTILGYGQILHERLKHDPEMQTEVEEVMRAGERAVELTSQLLALGRRQVEPVKSVNVNAVVMETDRLLRRTLGEDIELVTMPGDGLHNVKVESGKLQQVIMNLAINARDAMPEGGTLTITTSQATLDQSSAVTHAGLAKVGEYVEISVKDTGSGITEDVRAHIFEPFYTTKDKSKGSGLGLSMVYGIVKQADGWVDVRTKLGEGTEFVLYFPRADDDQVEEAAAFRASTLMRGNETILLVEDEKSVRRFTAKILEALGYKVLVASNGGEAVILYESKSDTIDMVLTDLVMPLMNGREMVKKLVDKGYDRKVLYMSGFSEDVATEEDETPLIQKPFTQEELSSRLRAVFDGN